MIVPFRYTYHGLGDGQKDSNDVLEFVTRQNESLLAGGGSWRGVILKLNDSTKAETCGQPHLHSAKVCFDLMFASTAHIYN